MSPGMDYDFIPRGQGQTGSVCPAGEGREGAFHTQGRWVSLLGKAGFTPCYRFVVETVGQKGFIRASVF